MRMKAGDRLAVVLILSGLLGGCGKGQERSSDPRMGSGPGAHKPACPAKAIGSREAGEVARSVSEPKGIALLSEKGQRAYRQLGQGEPALAESIVDAADVQGRETAEICLLNAFKNAVDPQQLRANLMQRQMQKVMEAMKGFYGGLARDPVRSNLSKAVALKPRWGDEVGDLLEALIMRRLLTMAERRESLLLGGDGAFLSRDERYAKTAPDGRSSKLTRDNEWVVLRGQDAEGSEEDRGSSLAMARAMAGDDGAFWAAGNWVQHLGTAQAYRKGDRSATDVRLRAVAGAFASKGLYASGMLVEWCRIRRTTSDTTKTAEGLLKWLDTTAPGAKAPRAAGHGFCVALGYWADLCPPPMSVKATTQGVVDKLLAAAAPSAGPHDVALIAAHMRRLDAMAALTPSKDVVDQEAALTTCLQDLAVLADGNEPQREENLRGSLLAHEAAAEGNDPAAMLVVGVHHAKGYGTVKDTTKMRQWYEAAAHLGNGIAHCYLGEMYERGVHVRANEAKAQQHYRRSADAWNTDGLVNAGRMYELGKGAPYRPHYAAALYSLSAHRGNAEAMCYLANFYHKGIVVPRHDKLAHTWWKKSADLGYPTAVFNLACAHYRGIGTGKDPARYRELLGQAAERGHEPSMYYLSLACLRGIGGETARDTGMEWLRKAAGNGYKPAKTKLSELNRISRPQPGFSSSSLLSQSLGGHESNLLGPRLDGYGVGHGTYSAYDHSYEMRRIRTRTAQGMAKLGVFVQYMPR